MKKSLLLPLLATAVFTSQAWALICCWEDNESNAADGGGYCGPVADPTCGQWGTEMSNCSSCNTKNKTSAQPCGFFCKWDKCESLNTDPEGTYGTVITNCEDAIANCDANSNGRYSDNACTNAVTQPKTPLGCCRWETGGPCWTIRSGIDPEDGKDGADKVEECNQYGDFWNGQCPDGTGGCPTTPPVNGSNPPTPPTPIFSGTLISGLTVAPYGNTLHISSARASTVSLFTMAGAKVFSGKVAAGNSVFSLGKQKQGVYYAVVQSGANKQTVQVMLK